MQWIVWSEHGVSMERSARRVGSGANILLGRACLVELFALAKHRRHSSPAFIASGLCPSTFIPIPSASPPQPHQEK
jgi:hypothetical protein